MREIQLTQGQIALVDDEDYEYLSQWKWFAHWSDYTQSYYAHRMDGKFPNRKVVIMARELMRTPKGMKCDHINHDTLDNQKENLRNVTDTQNNMNSRTYKNNKLGEKNICMLPDGRYKLQIYKNNKRVVCKEFSDLVSAISERDEQLKKFHGEFAYTGEKQ
jgi:hypothetical protein